MDSETDDDSIEFTKNKWKIDSYLIPAKVAYFLSCSRYAINEFFVLYFVSIGFSSGDAGLLTALQLLGGIISAPFWCLLADEKRIHRTLFTIVSGVSVLTMSSIPILNVILSDNPINKCPYDLVSNISTTKSGTTHTKDRKIFLYILLVSSFVSSVFDGCLTSFIDCGTIQRMHTSSEPTSYGKQRLYGALGYASGSIMYSISIKYYPESNVSCYTGIFITYGIFCTLLTLSCNWLFKGIEVRNKTKDVKVILKSVLYEFDTLFFFTCSLCAGIAQGVWYAYIFLYMKEMDSPTLLLGFSLPTTCVTASIVFYYSTKIIDALCGPFSAMGFSFFAWMLRFFALSYINNPYLVIVIDLLHGFTFSLFRTASLEYVKIICDPLITASLCGINNTMNTLGIMIGNLVGGYIHDKVGSKHLFQIVALFCLLSGIIMFLKILIRRIHRSGFQALP